MTIFQRKFYERPTVLVAQELLGALLVRMVDDQIVSGVIVETEAYGGADDPASHAHGGETKRNGAMLGPVGHAYVYRSYGIHNCINIVARENGAVAGGVLVRAIQPVDGIDVMRFNRNFIKDALLTNGPGKLTQALNIDMSLNNHDITVDGELYIVQQEQGETILATPRVGISRAQDRLWRFVFDKK